MAQSKTQRILDILELSDGMRFTDIQRVLWEMTHPKGSFTREFRGYWCTNLLGGGFYHAGILRFFATKGPDGLWRRNSRPHHGTPWTTMKSASRR